MVFFVVRWLVSRLSVQKVTGSIRGTKTFLEKHFCWDSFGEGLLLRGHQKCSPTPHFERQTLENLKCNIINKPTLSRQRKLDILDFKVLMEKN